MLPVQVTAVGQLLTLVSDSYLEFNICVMALLKADRRHRLNSTLNGQPGRDGAVIQAALESHKVDVLEGIFNLCDTEI